ATSSQGLLYMAEVMHYASGGRVPLVMMNANRSVALPWSIFGDQRDSLSLLDSGWIQAYVEDAQESLDMIIQAYAIAENKDVLTPVMINLDGFVLTHTFEAIDIPTEEQVTQFLPEFELEGKMDLDNPKNLFFSSSPAHNILFKAQQYQAMENSRSIIEKVDKQYEEITGRGYGGLVTGYKTEDAEIIIITLGSITGLVKDVVDSLRIEGQKVGLVKIRFMRPFPEKEILELCKNASKIGVLEKDISFGYHGTVYTNVADALKTTGINLVNYIAGLGGKNISFEDIKNIFNELKSIDAEDPIQIVNFVGVES
ncbi:MAG: transketolase C-terminal domain-containing protein, partial [Ruminiclostridium sp.]